MSIKPFKDKASIDVGNFQEPVSGSVGMDTIVIDQHRQGVNVRGMQDFRLKLAPYISDRGFPFGNLERFNPEIEDNHWGQPKLFEDPSEAIKSGFSNGPGPAPFDDIVGRWNPQLYINDSGNQQYPMVLLSPNYLDPAQMDGVIEPLVIRNKMSNTMTEGPHEAHQIRATLQPSSGPEILGKSAIVSNFIEFNPSSKIPAYFDSQNEVLPNTLLDHKGDKVFFSIPAEGYAFPIPKVITPYDDSSYLNKTTINFADFEVSSSFDDVGNFIGDPRFGIFGKSTVVGFTYSNGNTLASPHNKHTGNKRINGTDSIAFGGLLK